MELRLGVLSSTPDVPPLEEESSPPAPSSAIAAASPEPVEVTSTSGDKPRPSPYQLRVGGAEKPPTIPAGIDGTAQSYTFDYTDLPNGVYEL